MYSKVDELEIEFSGDRSFRSTFLNYFHIFEFITTESLSENLKGPDHLEDLKYIWTNIKTEFKENDCEITDWIHTAHEQY